MDSIWGVAGSVVLQPFEDGSEVWEGWGSVVLVVSFLVLITVVAVVVVWQVSALIRARVLANADAAREEAYRRLAERVTSSEERTETELQTISESVADMRVRITAIERMLREVE